MFITWFSCSGRKRQTRGRILAVQKGRSYRRSLPTLDEFREGNEKENDVDRRSDG